MDLDKVIEEILNKYWEKLRKIEPLQIHNFIQELTDYDKEHIEAVTKSESKSRGVDKLIEAIKRRSQRCFFSFIVVLENHGYNHIAKDIIERYNLTAYKEFSELRNDKNVNRQESSRSSDSDYSINNRNKDNISSYNALSERVQDRPNESKELNINKPPSESPGSTSDTNQLDLPDADTPTLLHDVGSRDISCWGTLLEKKGEDQKPGWKKLVNCLPKDITRQKYREIDKSEEPGMHLLDYLADAENMTVEELLKLTEKCQLNAVSRAIKVKLGLVDHQPVEQLTHDGMQHVQYENVILGIHEDITASPDGAFGYSNNDRPKDKGQNRHIVQSNIANSRETSVEDNVLTQNKDVVVNKRENEQKITNLYHSKLIPNDPVPTCDTKPNAEVRMSKEEDKLGSLESKCFKKSSKFNESVLIEDDGLGTVCLLQAQKLQKYQQNDGTNTNTDLMSGQNHNITDILQSSLCPRNDKQQGKKDVKESKTAHQVAQHHLVFQDKAMEKSGGSSNTESLNDRSLTELKRIQNDSVIEPESGISSLTFDERCPVLNVSSVLETDGTECSQAERLHVEELPSDVSRTQETNHEQLSPALQPSMRHKVVQPSSTEYKLDDLIDQQQNACQTNDQIITRPSHAACRPVDYLITRPSSASGKLDNQVLAQPSSATGKLDNQVVTQPSSATGKLDNQVVTQPSSATGILDNQVVAQPSSAACRPVDQVITQPSSSTGKLDNQVITKPSSATGKLDNNVITQPSSSTSKAVSYNQVITDPLLTAGQSGYQVIVQPFSTAGQSGDQVIIQSSSTTGQLGDQVIVQPSSATGQSGDQVIVQPSSTAGQSGDQVIVQPSSASGQSGDQVIVQPSSATGQSGDQVIIQPSSATGQSGDQGIIQPSSATGQSGDQVISHLSTVVAQPSISQQFHATVHIRTSAFESENAALFQQDVPRSDATQVVDNDVTSQGNLEAEANALRAKQQDPVPNDDSFRDVQLL